MYLSIVAAGGTQQDRKNLLTNLFTGDLIRYSGGVSVNAIVFLIASDDSKILFGPRAIPYPAQTDPKAQKL